MNDKQREWAKQYYAKNKERLIEYQKKYYKEHKSEITEKMKDYVAEYRRTHRDYFRLKSLNNYRKKCGLPPLKNKI